MVDFDFDAGNTVHEAYNAENGSGDGKAWTRDNRDNKLFKSLQVKDLSKILTDDAIFVWDADGVPFKCAGMVEDDYIIATNVATGDIHEAKNVTEFWGVGKKVGVNSWVGIQNVERSVLDLPEWDKTSFTIEKKKRLKTKYINSATGERFKNPKRDEDKNIIKGTGDPLSLKQKVDMDLSDVIAIMEMRINEVRLQWDVKKFLMCLGSGEVFRDHLKLPQPYKGQRDPVRPILLKEARAWLAENYPSEIAPPFFETDDVVEWYAAKSHLNYRKTGKHTHVIIAEDKDAGSNPKVWVNYGRAEGAFKQPQAVLIEDSSKHLGVLELVQKSKSTETKGTGIKWLVMQAFCFGDSSDNYHPYLKLDKELRKHIKYGQTEAYKDFVKLDTLHDVLQKAVDNMYEWFPKGLRYTAHDGTKMDIDTFTWMNEVCWPVAYMTRSHEDIATFKTLCDYAKVDYSKATDNNIEKVSKLKEGDALLNEIVLTGDAIAVVINLLKDKSGKAADKKERLDAGIVALENIRKLDNLFE